EEDGVRPHPERLRPRGWAHAGGGDGKLPGRGRADCGAGGVAALHGRPDPRGRLMRILLTNDDGIEAEGLECLERIARELSDDVWTVAPAVEQSGKGRGITLTEPLRVNRVNDRRF